MNRGMAQRPQSPSDPSNQSRSRQTARIRAPKACRRCNEKRVKCDASERGIPCTRCIQRKEPDCRLIQSRRGAYARKPRSQPVATAQNFAEHQILGGDNDPAVVGTTSEEVGDGRPAPAPHAVTVEPLTSDFRSHDVDRHRLSTGRERGSVSSSNGIAPQQGGRPEEFVVSHAHQSPVAPEVVSDQDGAHLESGEITSPVADVGPNDSTSRNPLSYRNISWTDVFNHLLEGRRGGEDGLNKCSITYLGESFPLSAILQDLQGEHAGRLPLHHPGPSYPVDVQVTESSGLGRPAGMGPEELAFLETKGAFSAPANDTMETLIDVFLERVFPIYPIVNRQEFLELHKSRKIPWILLHALCSVASIFCSPEVLYRAGFGSRQQARGAYYSRAKALFDMGYETNKIVLLQVTILLSFWGGSPTDNWNFYSWIGMGVIIAETIGCHRSMAGTSIRKQDRSLLKRLWWVLVLRDATSAALIGRPFKVNLDNSDVEALSFEDFEHDVISPTRPANQHTHYSILYQIHVIRLTIILRRIITARFQPRREQAVSPGYCRQLLADWRNELPPELAWSGNALESLNIFASTLSSMYNHHVILTYLCRRSAETTQNSPSNETSEKMMAETAMKEAAQQIAQVACSVVTKSAVLLAPHEIFHGIFMAAAVFYLQTKGPSRIIAQLGLLGLTNCKLVFHATRETWDPSPWFLQLLDKGISASQPGSVEEHRPANSTDQTMQDLAGASYIDTNMNAFLPFGNDMWQDLSVVGSLFEMPPNTSTSMAIGPDLDDRSGSSWFCAQPFGDI